MLCVVFLIVFCCLPGVHNYMPNYGTKTKSYKPLGNFGVKTKQSPSSSQYTNPILSGIPLDAHLGLGWSFESKKGKYSASNKCNIRLKEISNAHTKCSNDICKVTCLKGYQFPSGETTLTAVCADNTWRFRDSDLGSIVDCEAICFPPCENNGICIAPGRCGCPENFFGPRCETRKEFCLTKPPTPKYSRISCTMAACSITCMKGFTFPDGSTITNLKCVDSNWIPSRKDFNTIPDCVPTCSPECENGGNCISHNICQCPTNFVGRQCQYSAERCSPKKLLNKVGYNCHGTVDAVTCQLSCPQNIEFEFPPATLYTCEFSKGYFEPQDIPKCVYGENMKVIETSGSYGGTYQKSSQHRYDSQEQAEDVDTWESIISTYMHKKKPGFGSEWQSTSHPSYEISDMLLYKSLKGSKLKAPVSGICFTWGKDHVKTFDGILYKMPLYCSHILLQSQPEETLRIVMKTCPFNEPEECFISLKIFLEDSFYQLTSKDGLITLSTPKKTLPIPVQLPGVKITYLAQLLKIDLELQGVVIFWNGEYSVSIEVNSGLWNRTSGLCGTLDSDPQNDFMSKDGTIVSSLRTFVDSWKAADDRDKCLMETVEELPSPKKCPSGTEDEATKLCEKIFNNMELQKCLTDYNKTSLAKLCFEDYCNSPLGDICEAISMLVKECQFNGKQLREGWRNYDICPMKCDKNRMYMACGPASGRSCGSAVAAETTDVCNEGCFCPEGTLQHNGDCIPVEQCPCRLRNKEFEAGSKVKRDCNTCICKNGVWECTDISCGARCAAVGDPHYITFDGKRYDFMGKCSYYLMKMDNLSIEAENIECSGSISEAMDFTPTNAVGIPTCTRAVIIRLEINQRKIAIKLGQGRTVHINDKLLTDFPKILGNDVLIIRQASSIFLTVDFYDGLRIWWDGVTRAYIDAPSSYRKKTQGLCGTFNSDMQDDFLTSEGDVENSVEAFADKWRTKDSCDDIPETETPIHPCKSDAEKKEKAEEYCSKLISEIFEGCHWSVDPAPFFEDCMFDVCACKGDAGLCFCPILAAYGAECSRQGIITNWRNHVKECAIECPSGQVYDECADSCQRSCEDIATKDICRGHCVEGCRCPPGQYLNSKNECIPEAKCPCSFEGLYFENSYKEVRPGRRFLELCECSAGRWVCDVANPHDRELYPPANEMQSACAKKQFADFSKCLPTEPKTCKNMHAYEETYDEDCKPGCVCTEGYILDTIAHTCVLPENCSCHHGGKSYGDGDVFKEDCSTCKCVSGKWNCVVEKCASTCSVWGDSHFTTFDKKDFDFQGACDYVLSKGTLPGGDGFSITIQNVLCGTMGVTCSKSVKISLIGQLTDSVLLSSDPSSRKKLEKYKKSTKLGPSGFSVYNSGTMTAVDVKDLGLQLKWDHGTRVYVKLSEQWKGKTRGLCGNYNGNAQDDMMNPSQGLETSALLFGHSWKLQEFCDTPSEQIDACAQHPARKFWAHKKCGILKSKTFEACHSEVPVEKYLKRCIFDTCACDKGGDCECLCTAIAAYAHECSTKGVAIAWRTPELCPMQCNKNCSAYSSCIPACPVETCDNYLEQEVVEKMCHSEVCVEGCNIKPCEEGFIYFNDSYTECVPKKDCKPICMKIKEKIYYEGDIIRSDECHTCRCSRNKEVCSGAPCSYTTYAAVTSTERASRTEESECIEGWTDWSNIDTAPITQDSYDPDKPIGLSLLKQNDIEPIPKFLDIFSVFGYGACSSKFMRQIECRVVGTHQSSKETTDNSYCTLEKGLICVGSCHDYEIRVYCGCTEGTTTSTTSVETTTRQPTCKTTDPYIEYPDDCYKFRQCEQQPDGTWDYEEKTCGPSMMFNPATKVCDWRISVEKIKPICEKVPLDIVATTTEETQRFASQLPPQQNCDPAIPHIEHQLDCFRFWHCSQVGLNWELVEKTCGPSMMFNPTTMTCDWPANVLKIKPECGTIEPAKNLTLEQIKQCPEGQTMSECAIPCKKACHYYEKKLYNQQLCKPYSETCEPGCVDESWPTNCNENEVWRDKKTCVKIADCPCMSHSGKFVKPNDVFKESKCEICQCLDNCYVCSKLPCEEEVAIPTIAPIEEVETFVVPTEKPLIVPSAVTPPKKCPPENLVPVINGENKLPDSAFNASSVLGSSFLPKFARLHERPSESASGSWSPILNDEEQYLQITLPKAIPLYGIIVQGSPLFDQYVTNFKILYSADNNLYHYLADDSGSPQLCNGPIDPSTPIQSQFKIPIEAQVVRICPINWHGGIAMRVELLGCSSKPRAEITEAEMWTSTESSVSTEKVEQVISDESVEPVCDDPMGINTGVMSSKQITASSIKPNFKGELPELRELLRLDSPNGWQPALDSPNEFITFDFLELRNITGVKTQGGRLGWVTAFNILYSTNGHIWNKILAPDGNSKIFLANTNSETPKSNYFQYPVQARYLKLVPKKWENLIEMKIEPIGCFIPYNTTEDQVLEVVQVLPLTSVKNCPVCPGIEMPTDRPDGSACKCDPPTFWDGKTCNPRTQCPCIVGHLRYDVGAQYQSEDCMQCVCVLGGVSQCKPQECPPCQEGLRPVKSINCICSCEACPEFQKLCPSSGDCIPENFWCNGIQDCMDDELNCMETAFLPTEPPQLVEDLNKTKTCPDPHCPPGMTVKIQKSKRKMSAIFESSSKFLQKNDLIQKKFYRVSKIERKNTFMKTVQKKNKKKSALPKKLAINTLEMDISKEDDCFEFTCVPKHRPLLTKDKERSVECPRSECPPGYLVENDVILDTKTKTCPKYSCVPRPQNDAICLVNGRSFKTFDGVEYKYEICYHILARDFLSGKWSIIMAKDCSEGGRICRKQLIINDHKDNLVVVLHSNLTVSLNGFNFMARQLEKPTKIGAAFAISQPGNTILLVSINYGFWLMYDSSGNLKIGVSSKNTEAVEGLCGYFNNIADDDKRLPSGAPAESTIEFADAWFIGNVSKEICKPQTCPRHIQEAALEICNTVRDNIFSSCASAFDYDRFISNCLESTCECIKNSGSHGDESQCKCSVLENYVKECYAAKPDLDIANWRLIYNCEVPCPAPLVYEDCYKRRCEPSCENLKTESCPIIPNVCFAGCYCPAGMVRKGEQCVPITDCMDCTCDGFGKSRYITFDRFNFTFDGNCTYLLSRNILPEGGHTFEVYSTLRNCDHVKRKISTKTKSKQRLPIGGPSSCVNSLHIIYKKHKIDIKKKSKKMLDIMVDKEGVESLPFDQNWIKINEIFGQEILISLPEASVEMSITYSDMAFTIRLPSVLYASKLEGLCGDCNGDPNNDLQVNPEAPQETLPEDSMENILQSWVAHGDELGQKDEPTCQTKPESSTECIPPPPEKDPCMKILEDDPFRQCHILVDPVMYVLSCQLDMCKAGGDERALCDTLSAYTKDCFRQGLCLNWRTPKLCPFQCPEHLSYTSCECARTCDTVAAEKVPDTSRKLPTKDSKTKTDCSPVVIDGCSCPHGQVLNANTSKCIPEKHCLKCDDGHFADDDWAVDKCTQCRCGFDGKIICTKENCPVTEKICEEDFTSLEITKPDDCCPKYICVPRPTLASSSLCEAPLIPACGQDQIKKLKTGPDGCAQYFCECVPTSECPPLKLLRELALGETIVNETLGCCPKFEIKCDVLKCPGPPEQCENPFYEVVKKPETDSCCPEFICKPPKDLCLATINEDTVPKKLGEKWISASDPCLSHLCTYGSPDLPAIIDEKETCDTNCSEGFEYTVNADECCGKCLQTMCNHNETFYNPGDTWYDADNCTTYKCENREENFYIVASEKACPDVSSCPESQIYKKECCMQCKLDTENCKPILVSEPETVGLIKTYQSKHGLCTNKEAILNFTECQGACMSGSKFNAETQKHETFCKCCKPEKYDILNVSLRCNDGHKVEKQIQAPSSCICLPCAKNTYSPDDDAEYITVGTAEKIKGIKTKPSIKA